MVVTDEFFSIVLDGTAHAILGHGETHSHEEEAERRYQTKLPLHEPGLGPLQVFVADYTVSSLVDSAIDLSWFDLSKPFKGNELEPMIHGIATAFGEQTDLDVVMRPVKNSQEVVVTGGTRGVTKVKCDFDVHIQNPFADRKMYAVYMPMVL